jgi:hypothetical protein
VFRRSFAGALLALVLVPSVALAGSWRTYSSKAFGLAFHYPSTWALSVTPPGPMRQINAFSSSTGYSFVVAVYPVKPRKSPRATLAAYVAYTRSINAPSAGQMTWKTTTFAGKAAEGAVSFPPTEGGVPLAIGQYVFGNRSHIYSVTIQARTKHLPKNLASFPTVYRQIVKTWRFL